MQFTKKEIVDADIDSLTPQDKKYLLTKFFPESLPEWKVKLRTSWQKTESERLWSTYRGESAWGDFGIEYRITHKQLKSLAETFRASPSPSLKKGTGVTDFSKWVMFLYLGSPNPSSLKRGKHVERSVARLAKPSENTDWTLKYRDPLEPAPQPLKISNLTLNGQPLWGVPDLVYQHKTSGECLIIERKASDKPIPRNGWPNLKAQLWAYSHIDVFKDAPTITLVGEIWDIVEGQPTRRAVLRWSQTDKKFNDENLELFSLYGGVRHT